MPQTDTHTGPVTNDETVSRFASLLGDDTDEREDADGEEGADVEGEGETDPETEGEEAEGEEDEDAAIAAEPGQTYTVKVDGKELQVTQEELLNGYQRQADYTRKAMAVAEARKANDAELIVLRQERQQYAQWAGQMLEKLKREAPVEPDWHQLRATDPIGFATTWAEHQQYQQKQQQIAQQYQHVMQKNQQDEATALKRTLAEEDERLVAALPEWTNEDTAKKEKTEMLAFGKKHGFSDDELSQVYDHRTVVILRKAMLYDKLQATRPQVNAQRQGPKVAGPNAAPSSALAPTATRKSAVQRLSKSGSVKDAAALFERFI